jgi:type II secretory pathway pseudopilin PulG
MTKTNIRGFTLAELSLTISALTIAAVLALPEHIKARDEAKEAEVKANLHTIQEALERYAVDAGAYPAYILGGDIEGWDPRTGCRAVILHPNETSQPPVDALIRYNYLTTYPHNPFIGPGGGISTIIPATGASVKPGDGDVRFGWSGEKMGNCLDDPRVLFDRYFPTKYSYTMYPVAGAFLGVLNTNSPNSFYTMGGLPEWSRENMSQSADDSTYFGNYWPGEFFYRAGGQFDFESTEGTGSEFIWGWLYTKIDKYMLGAYGSLRTEGLDVIRLTSKEGQAACMMPNAIMGSIQGQYYQDHSNPEREASHPSFNVRVTYSNPEVFGGGEKGLMPQFPYFDAEMRDWLYGAPDSFPDGIVLVLTSPTPMSM